MFNSCPTPEQQNYRGDILTEAEINMLKEKGKKYSVSPLFHLSPSQLAK